MRQKTVILMVLGALVAALAGSMAWPETSRAIGSNVVFDVAPPDPSFT